MCERRAESGLGMHSCPRSRETGTCTDVRTIVLAILDRSGEAVALLLVHTTGEKIEFGTAVNFHATLSWAKLVPDLSSLSTHDCLTGYW